MAYQGMLLLLLILEAGVGVEATWFNCLREFESCGSNGACNTKEPNKCTCNSGYSAVNNYHCVLDTATNCATVCNFGGVCKTIGGSATCLCPETHYGTQCGNKRLTVTCTTQMVVTVVPLGPFPNDPAKLPKVYLNGKGGSTACPVTTTSTADPYIFTKNVLSSESACFSGGSNSNVTDLLIDYADDVAGSDQLFSIDCTTPSTPVVTELSVDVGSLGAAGGDGSYTGITIEVWTQGGTAAVTDITVGQLLEVKVTKDNSVYNKMKVLECKAYDKDPTAVDAQSLTFVSGGCPTSTVISGDHTLAGDVITIPIRGFVFAPTTAILTTATTANLIIQCSILMCPLTSDADCAAPTCSGAFFNTGLGRRRREAEENGEEIQVLTTALKVHFSNSTLPQTSGGGSSQQSGVDTASCLSDPGTQSVVSVLGIVVCGLLVSTVVLAFQLARRAELQRKHDNY